MGSFFFFKQKTAYEMRISDWSSDVCSSDLGLNCVIVVLRLGRDSAALEPGYVSASGQGGARVDGLAGDGEKHLFLFGRIARYREVAYGDGLLQFAPVVGDGAERERKRSDGLRDCALIRDLGRDFTRDVGIGHDITLAVIPDRTG